MPNLIKSHGSNVGVKHQLKQNTRKKQTRSARPWRRKRRRVLSRDLYTCQSCGRIDSNLEVDHIMPLHKGGADTQENLQSLCGICHKLKTASENGIMKSTMYPAWMPVSTKPLKVVCGRPAAGKSTFVRETRGPYDLVIDLDLMAREINKQLHELTRDQRKALIRIRNDRIADYVRGNTKHPQCWIVTAAGREYQREYWKQRGAEIIIIDVPVDICERRIAAQDHPGWRKEERMQTARNWN